MASKLDTLIKVARHKGAIRASDLTAAGIPRRYLSRLAEKGVLVRIDRGIYELADREVTENVTMAAVAKRVPHGVICLLSAMQLHGLTTQQPAKVWLAIERGARVPQTSHLPIKAIRLSGAAFNEGIQTTQIEGTKVRLYNPAKTVADCFKYRNKIGLDVALEVLRESRKSRKITNDDLWHYAKICRVANVMRPYLEAIA